MDNLLKVKGTYRLPYAIKAEWTGYLIFSILFIPISLLWVVVAFKNPSQNFLLPNLIPLVILTIFLIWLASLKIVLNSDGIFYKTLFSKGFKIKFSEIEKVGVDIGMYPSGSEQQGSQRRGYYRFNIFKHDVGDPFAVYMKPFSKRDLAILIDAIMVANPSVKLDKLSRNLYEGNFKPIVSQGIRKFWQVTLWLFWVFLLINLLRHFA
jgi:hypothetical protein